jgi:hypothetical protein
MIISINNRVLELVQHLHPEVVILERVKYVSAVNATRATWVQLADALCSEKVLSNLPRDEWQPYIAASRKIDAELKGQPYAT